MGTAAQTIKGLMTSNNNTRVPDNVRFLGGTVTDGGRHSGLDPSDPSDRAGVQFAGVRSVEFRDVKVVHPATDGFLGENSGTVTLHNCSVVDAPGKDFNFINVGQVIRE